MTKVFETIENQWSWKISNWIKIRDIKIRKVQIWPDIRIWGSHLLAIVWSWSYFWLSHHALCLSRFWIKSRRKFKETISKSVSLQPQISWTYFAMFSLYLLECSLHISKEYQRKFKENVSSVPACNLKFLEQLFQCWMQSAQFWEDNLVTHGNLTLKICMGWKWQIFFTPGLGITIKETLHEAMLCSCYIHTYKHIQSGYMLHERLHACMITLKAHLLRLDKRVLDYTQALFLCCSCSLQITIFSLGGYNL